MGAVSSYIAKSADESGVIHYSDDENAVWNDLISKQNNLIKGRMCEEFIAGLEKLAFTTERIPQLDDINATLLPLNGWSVQAVPALIDFNRFFKMLSEKKFPAATFIRRREHIEYLQEPDIFHEVYGHIPLLCEPGIADFTRRVGKLGSTLPESYHVWLARLYWMTIEFGLIKTKSGLRAYGAGIASSRKEIIYALQQRDAGYQAFDLITVLRTPYRIDELQPRYFVLNDFNELAALSEDRIVKGIEEAKSLGVFQKSLAS